MIRCHLVAIAILLALSTSMAFSSELPVATVSEAREALAGFAEETSNMAASHKARMAQQTREHIAIQAAKTDADRQAAEMQNEVSRQVRAEAIRSEKEAFVGLIQTTQQKVWGLLLGELASGKSVSEIIAETEGAMAWREWPREPGAKRISWYAAKQKGIAAEVTYQVHVSPQGAEFFLFKLKLCSPTDHPIGLVPFAIRREGTNAELLPLGEAGFDSCRVTGTDKYHEILGFVAGSTGVPDILTWTGPDGTMHDVHVYRWEYDSQGGEWRKERVLQRDGGWLPKYPGVGGRVELYYERELGEPRRLATYDPETGLVEDIEAPEEP